MSQIQNTRVLIVDDEEVLRKAMVFDFKRKGYQVFEAQSGRMALEILDNNEIDLIISDIRMPDGDGLSLLQSVKSRNPEKPVVLLMTGFADINPEDAYQLGADALFNKPFDRKELLAVVQERLMPRSEQWRCTDSEHLEAFQLNLDLENIKSSITAHILNIGRGGFFAALTGTLPKVGEKIRFSIRFKGEKSIKEITGEGTVRWVRAQHSEEFPSGCGVEFTYLEPSDRAHILNLIAELKRKCFIPKV